MSHPVGPTTLADLPPTIGDAAVAAVLLRDLAAALVDGAAGRHDATSPTGVEVDDDAHFRLTEPAASPGPTTTPVAHPAPELAPDRLPDARSDVYAAACLALTRYLGHVPVAAVATSRGASSTIRLAAIRQGHRTAPPRLGAMPAPFRTVFAQAMAKEPHLRPTPAVLVALLDTAFAAVGPDAEADTRARLHRLVVLAHAFVPAAPRAGALVADDQPARMPLHVLPMPRPAFSRRANVARAALIGAVAVVAVGGVAAVVVLGVGGRNAPVDGSLGVTTQQVLDPTTGPATTPAPSTSAAVATTPAAAVPVVPATAGRPGPSHAGRTATTSARPTPRSTAPARPTRSPAPPRSTPPSAVVTPTTSIPPTSTPPTTAPPSSAPPTRSPPTSSPPSSNPPTSSPPSTPPAAVGAVDASTPATSATPSG